MIIRKTFKEERNDQYLKFFSTICTYKTKGILQNQLILYKILQSETSQKALLIKMKR